MFTQKGLVIHQRKQHKTNLGQVNGHLKFFKVGAKFLLSQKFLSLS